MLKKIFCLLIASLFLISNVCVADINDWCRGDGTDAVEGDETISTEDTQITNYLQDPLEKALAAHITGCTLTVTSDTVLTISAGSVVTTSATGVIRMRQNTSTITADNTADGPGDPGGMDDGGAVAINTWYFIYAVSDADATTFTSIISTSASAPTEVGGGASYYRLIGCALTDATSDWLKAYYFGNGNTVTVMWDVPMNETTTLSANAWSAALDCASSMPSISTLGIFGLSNTATEGSSQGTWIRPNGSTWSTNNSNGITGDTLSAIGGQRICATDSSQQIQYYNTVATSTNRVDTEGFVYIR